MAAGLSRGGKREGRVFMAYTRSQEENTESPLGSQRGMERRIRKKEKRSGVGEALACLEGPVGS